MNLRTMTLGLDPEATSMQGLEDKACRLFAAAERLVGQSGRALRTRRLVLPPVNAGRRFSKPGLLALLKWLAPLAERCGARWFNVPFTTFTEHDLRLVFDAALEVIRRYPNAFVNAIVATGGQIQRQGILHAARFITSVSRLSPSGYDNFRVGAACNCPPGTPFFPFAHHQGPDGFSVGLEQPPAFYEVLKRCAGQPLESVREALLAMLIEELAAVDGLCRQLEVETELRYLGLDASLAPFPDERGSVARLLELLGADGYGASGTLFFTAFLTDILREAVARSGARSVGFNGVMASLLEDPALCQSRALRTISVDSLLSCAAVCGCGLDMVPIPGDSYEEEIAAVILDLAALSTALGKPLGARLLPIPSKRENEFTAFGHDFIYNCRVLALRNRALPRELFAAGPPLGLRTRISGRPAGGER